MREFTNRFYTECEECGREEAVESIRYIGDDVVEHRVFCPDCGYSQDLKREDAHIIDA